MTEYVQHQHVPQPPDSVNVLRFILPNLWPSIKAYTCATDLRASIQAGIDYCATLGIATLYFPNGKYPVDVSSTALKITTDGLSLLGAGQTPSGPTVIYALSNSLGNADYACMLNIRSALGNSVRGLTFDRNNTLGNAIVLADTVAARLNNIGVSNTTGVLWKAANSANSTTDFITGPGGTSTIFSNNDHIEFWVDGDTAVSSALPAPLVVNKAYFVVNKSGNTFQVSLTPGGAAIDLTTNGAGHWGFHKYSCTWEASDATADTLQITGHPFVVGHQVAFSNPPNLSTVANMPVFVTKGISYWVVAVPDADHIKISTTPGGTPLDVTTAAGHSLKPQISLVYSPILGAQNLYTEIDTVRMIGCVTGIRLLPGEGGAGSSYGINSGTVRRIIGGTGHTFHGDFTLADNDFEGYCVPPMEAAVRLCGGHVKFRDSYIELGTGPVRCMGVLSEGFPDIDGVTLFGTDNSDVNSIGIGLLANAQPIGRVTNCTIANFDYDCAILIPLASDGETSFVFLGNECGNCARSSLLPNGIKTGTARNFGVQQIRNLGIRIGGTLVPEARQTANNPASLDLGLGNTISIAATAPHSISSLVTDGLSGTLGAEGAVYTLIAETANTTLATGAFITLSGADYTMTAGEALQCVADGSGKLRIVAPIGSVVAGTPASLQGALTGSVAAQNLFSAAPTPGTYEVSAYVRVGTAATSGTLQVALSYNDGSARSEAMYHINTTSLAPVKDLPVGATGGFQLVTLPIKVASGNPQISATFTGTAGSLSYTTDISVRRIK